MIRKILLALCALISCWSPQDAIAQCTGNMQAGLICGNPTGAAAPARGAAPGAFSTILSPAGATMTGPLILAADPVANLGAATKAYVDAVASGLSIKSSVAVATTASNITLSGEQTIDGVLTSANRVLVKNQTLPAQNGVYVSAAGAWTRVTDMDVWSEVVGSFIFISSGTINANTGWVAQVTAGGTIGTTPMPWTQFSATTGYTAGLGLTLTGNVFAIAGRTGNTTNFATATGTLTSGRCVQWDASANLIQANAGCGSITSVTAGTGLTGGTITTTGTIALNLASNNTWTGQLQTNGNAYFKNGKPWADVIAWGAVCDNSTNDFVAIQNAVSAVDALGGGTVFFPPNGGNCVVGSRVQVLSSTCLVGSGSNTTGIQALTDISVLYFASGVEQACINNLGIYGYSNTAATQVTVHVESGAKVHMDHCRIWGGLYGLYTKGVDGRVYNCFISSAGTGAGGAAVLSQGANFYLSAKLDSTTGATTENAFLQLAPVVPGTVLENHLTDVDFSGNYTNSIKIDDSAGNSAVTWVHGGIMSSPIVITNARWTVFTTASIGNTSFTHAAGDLTIGNSRANAGTTLSGGGGLSRHCSNNINITC